MYPQTVRSVLQDLKEDGVVECEDGEYRAVPPTRTSPPRAEPSGTTN